MRGERSPARWAPRSRLAGIATVAIPAMLGCLPIPHATLASPAVVGTFQTVDGAPAAAVTLYLSTSLDEHPCTRTRLAVVTGTGGAFTIAATSDRHRFRLLLPVMPSPPRYHLCAARDARPAAYDGVGAEPDTVACSALSLPLDVGAVCFGRRRR